MKRSSATRSFTLVEMLISMAITLLIVLLLSGVLVYVAKTWQQTNARVTSFENARYGFERITRTLSQATLNPYWDYVDANGNRRTTATLLTFIPASYARCSDQAFLVSQATNFSTAGQNWACFFQSPLGQTTNQSLIPLDNLLNAMGFFVEFNNDANATTLSMKPSYITAAKWRYRLMELAQPTENLSVFTTTNAGWVTNAMNISASRQARPIADNVISLVFLPEDSSGNYLPNTNSPTYSYDSRNQSVSTEWNQLPAQVEVTMVAIDEASASRLAAADGTNAPSLVSTNYFANPTNYASDLTNLEYNLTTNSAHVNYRVFNTTVRIESAQWSTN